MDLRRSFSASSSSFNAWVWAAAATARTRAGSGLELSPVVFGSVVGVVWPKASISGGSDWVGGLTIGFSRFGPAYCPRTSAPRSVTPSCFDDLFVLLLLD